MANWNLAGDSNVKELFASLPATIFQKERWFADREHQKDLELVDSVQFTRNGFQDFYLTLNLFQIRPFPGYYYYLPFLITKIADGERGFLFEKKGSFFYDAALTYEYVTLIEELIENQTHIQASQGTYSFQSYRNLSKPRLHLLGSTSNTLLFVTRDYLLKNYRRIYPGVNPELKISAALTMAGSGQIPEIYGSISYWNSNEYTLGIIMESVENYGTGWERWGRLAKDLSIENERILQEEAGLLGKALGVLHRDLALVARENGEYGFFEKADLEERIDNVLKNIQNNPTAPGETETLVSKLTGLKKELSRRKLGAKFRIHGDLHLEQVIKTEGGWRFLDFEGEPLKPIPERENHDSPLKDLASMLRSVSYRFSGGAADCREIEGKVGAALTEGYLDSCREIGADFLPEDGELQTLLIFFQIERAVYECLYESKYRPDWLWIPRKGLAGLASNL